MNSGSFIVLTAGAVTIVGAVWLARHFLSPEARRERRRRRNNTPLASTANRPMVKFNLKTKKRGRK